ncbi:uncharacterized protein KY384_007070 [Bacidia gigantensis]|uniref:uncharacterized protein n=1 Tax=Bacidia gigantensis TaxID=2732470 RepID=UPI001D04BE57|nr:uncharacterized protein KY384_007070 [Bacidia gigantensis]KAG8528154.1 hypothetical protein KY384_007070 [Bacidia gigantensis]
MTAVRSERWGLSSDLTRPLKLEQLPPETLQNVINYVDIHDLLTVQTLSKRFHSLASNELYRSLDFDITCIETEDRGNVSSRVADALQTINISDYNYAQHIKNFRLGHTMARGSWMSRPSYGESLLRLRTVFDSKTDASKLLSTSILQMIRQASILECFMLPNLRRLHVRIDIKSTDSAYSHMPIPAVPPGLPAPYPSDPLGPLPNYLPQTYAHKRKKRPGSSFWAGQRAFSGFKTLNALNIIALCNLDCIPELRQCIKACSATLKNLTLTLDLEYTAKLQRSGNPPANELEELLSDTELTEDEIIYSPASPAAHGQQVMSETERRNQKMALDGLLASLFDLEIIAPKGAKLEKTMGLGGGQCLLEEEKSATITKMESVMRSLREDEQPGGKISLSEKGRLEKYRMMKELAELYISKHAPRPAKSSRVEVKKTAPPAKSYKPPKPKAPKYPTPIPGSGNVLDTFDFEEFLDDVGASMSSPMSLDSAKGGFSTKPWATPQNSYQPHPNYLPETLPPPPISGVTNASSNAALHSYKWGKLLDKNSPFGPSPYLEPDLQNTASFAPSPYLSSTADKSFSKQASVKNKTKPKSNGIIPPYSHPYPNGTINPIDPFSSPFYKKAPPTRAKEMARPGSLMTPKITLTALPTQMTPLALIALIWLGKHQFSWQKRASLWMME